MRFFLAVLGVSMSIASQANCVEGFSPKTMNHKLSIDQGFKYSQPKLEGWVQQKLAHGFRLHFAEPSYDKYALILEREDYEEEFESFVCEINNGMEFVVRKYNNHSWRQSYTFGCDKKVTIETQYDGVYPVGVIALCK